MAKRHTSLEHRNARVRRKVREEFKAKILAWYLQESGGVMPKEQCEKEDVYGEYAWWLEPPIPGVDNPVLVETTAGGWAISIQRMIIKPKVFMPSSLS